MNLKLKNSLILTGTLIIGIVLGVLISGRVMHARMANFRNFYTEKGFNREIMKIIKPTPEQREKLTPLFRQQAKRNHNLFMECRKKHHLMMENFKEELSGYLDKDQLRRLEKMEMRMRRNRPDNFPPSGMGPKNNGYERRHHRGMHGDE